MNIADIIVLLLAFILLGFGAFIFLNNYPLNSAPVGYQVINNSVNDSLPLVSSQFYPNMRYPNKTITYSIEKSCTVNKINKVEQAISILSDRTILNFVEVDSNSEINVLCSNAEPIEKNDSSHFIAGEGGPTKIVNTTDFNVILQGKVLLYRTNDCEKPEIALHELLHALGFAHNKNESSIMYPITGCDKYLDNYIVNDINSLYEIPSDPDLALTNVQAQRIGDYLDFTARIKNQGVVNSANSTLSVIVGGATVKTFPIKEIDIGSTRILNVKNIKLPKDSKSITFKVETSQKEITDANNILIAKVS